MRIKSVAVSCVYKSLLVVIGICGLLLVFGVFEGECRTSMLNYFTILSNILCVMYFITDLVYILRNCRGSETTWLPPLKGIVTMAVTVTCLVAHFVLHRGFNLTSTGGIAEFILHYVLPIMTVADWLLFDRKGYMKFYSPLVWTAAPMLYFAYAMIAARIGGAVSRYPYPFLDVDKLGWGAVILTVLVLFAAFIVLGYVFVLIDRGLRILSERKENSEESVV